MKIKYSEFLGDKPKKDVFYEIDVKVAALKARGIDVIDFGVGDPAKNTPPPQYVIDSMTQKAEENKFGGYPRYRGTDRFRHACCRYMQREFQVNLNPETEIITTIGSKEAVFHFPKAFINHNDIVICPTPGYPPFHLGTKAAYGKPYYVPLLEENNFLIDFSAIPKTVAEQAKIIWINYPNSPTGIMAPITWYEQLIDWAHQHNIIIAADEGAYIDLYYDKKPTSILEVNKEGIVAFYSLSKRNNMTDYRIGFAAGDERIIEGIFKLKNYQDNGAPQFIQDAAILALDDTTFVESLRQSYKEKRAILTSALEACGLPTIKSEASFFLWQKAPDGMSGAELAQILIDIGIVVMPGIALTQPDTHPNPGEHFIRIALMPTLENTHEAAKRIRDHLNFHHK